MKRGGFISQSLLDDALTIAIIESGVALRAFDAGPRRGPPRDPPDASRARPRGTPGRAAAGNAGDRRRGQAARRCCSGRPPPAAACTRARSERCSLRRAGEGRARHRRRGGDLAGRRRDAELAADAVVRPDAGYNARERRFRAKGDDLVPERTCWRSRRGDSSLAAGRGPGRRAAVRRRSAVDALTERRARQDLRRQIALLEQQLGELFASAFPRQGIEWSGRRGRRASGARGRRAGAGARRARREAARGAGRARPARRDRGGRTAACSRR